jgi:signal transduction histidine kinase
MPRSSVPSAARRQPVWTATLYWKFALALAAACCVVAAVLGVLVHHSAARHTTGSGRVHQSLHSLDRSIEASAALAVGLATLGGLLAAARITRRLRDTAHAARRFSSGDLEARAGTTRTKGRSRLAHDEVEAVAGALDSMAAALRIRLRTEQRFTADVAHELRTPLTGLHAAAELLPPGRPTELVRDRVQALRRLTEDLLEISRLDARVERANLDMHRLGPLVEQAVAATGLDAVVEVLEDTTLETDRRRLDRIVGNLIANAHRHGRPPVLVTVDGPVITVRDHGDGYPDDLLDQGPQRFRTESTASGKKGHGLGLTIAAGQARVLDAELRFANAPDGGAVTTISLRRTAAWPGRGTHDR